ncbi:hypothetical protein ACXR0M_03785 [Pseudomonas sp. Eth.TT006]
MNDVYDKPFLSKSDLEKSLSFVWSLEAFPTDVSEIEKSYGEGALDNLTQTARDDVVALFVNARNSYAALNFVEEHTIDIAEQLVAFAHALKTWADSVSDVVTELKLSDGFRRVEDLTDEQIQAFDTGELSVDAQCQFVNVADTMQFLKASVSGAIELVKVAEGWSIGLTQDAKVNIQPLIRSLLGEYGEAALDNFVKAKGAMDIFCECKRKRKV